MAAVSPVRRDGRADAAADRVVGCWTKMTRVAPGWRDLAFEVHFSRANRNWSARLMAENNDRPALGKFAQVQAFSRMGRAKRQRELVGWTWLAACRDRRVRPRLPCRVTLTRVVPDRREEVDALNLADCLKAVADEVARSLGTTDRDRRIRWVLRQRFLPATHALEVRAEWPVDGSRWVHLDEPAVVIHEPDRLAVPEEETAPRPTSVAAKARETRPSVGYPVRG